MAVGGSQSAVRVVVVDDDASLRELLSIDLQAAGMEVTLCDPASEDCVALIARARPDAVVLDWRIPGEPGPQVCRRLRDSEFGDELAIVFLSGLSDPRDQTVARHAGADAFCAKGFVGPRALAVKLRDAIALRAGSTIRPVA